jgi:hypothetical protein
MTDAEEHGLHPNTPETVRADSAAATDLDMSPFQLSESYGLEEHDDAHFEPNLAAFMDKHQYNLRERKDDMPMTNDIDKDPSDKYDPTKKPERMKHRNPTRATKCHEDRDQLPAGPKYRSFKSKYTALQHGGQLIFRIPLTTEGLKAKALSIPDTWPDEDKDHNFLDEGLVVGETRDGPGRSDGDYLGYKPLSDPPGEE